MPSGCRPTSRPVSWLTDIQPDSGQYGRVRVVEIYIHGGCHSEPRALALAEAIQKELPAWVVRICDAGRDRARTLGILVAPAFVVDEKVLAVGIPRSSWLLTRLRQIARGE